MDRTNNLFNNLHHFDTFLAFLINQYDVEEKEGFVSSGISSAPINAVKENNNMLIINVLINIIEDNDFLIPKEQMEDAGIDACDLINEVFLFFNTHSNLSLSRTVFLFTFFFSFFSLVPPVD